MLTKTTTDLRKQQILEAFAFRHATKRFADKQIPEEDFAFILETGRLSPSSFGYEPWRFLVIQDESLRERLAPFAWGAAGQLETASHFVILLARNEQDMHFDAPYINHMMQDVIGLTPEAQKGRHSFYRQFQESDFDLVSSKRAMRDWSAKQTYIALGNMMTSAAQIGIDSCPIEGFDQQAVEQLLREEGHLTDNLNVAVMAAFGYRNAAPAHAQTRQAIADLVDWV